MGKNKIFIQNFWYVNNYGACLTAYALYSILVKLDFEVELIDISSFRDKLTYKFKDFINHHCKTTNQIKNYSDLKLINKSNNIYITGSDQVFSQKRINNNYSYFLLDYIQPNSKKIAFSASFGVDKTQFLKDTDSEYLTKMKTSLKSFDFISVREKYGVDICKDIFEVDAKWIIDPVFLLDKSYYEDIANESTKNFNNKIVSCIFEENNYNIYSFLEKKYNRQIFKLWDWDPKVSVNEWLAAIKNCEFLITNSFHATCFAIIFNKPFICLSKDMGAASRFESLFEMLGIENQSIDSIDEIYKKDCVFKVNYEKVNQRIKEERQKGLDILQKVLVAPAEHFKEKQEVNIRFLEERILELENQSTLEYLITKKLIHIWLIIFHKYLPKFLKNLIRKLRDLCK